MCCCFLCPSVSIHHTDHAAISREKLTIVVYKSQENQSRFSRPLAKRQETTAQPHRNGISLLCLGKNAIISVLYTQHLLTKSSCKTDCRKVHFSRSYSYFSGACDCSAGEMLSIKQIMRNSWERRRKEKKRKKYPPQTN